MNNFDVIKKWTLSAFKERTLDQQITAPIEHIKREEIDELLESIKKYLIAKDKLIQLKTSPDMISKETYDHFVDTVDKARNDVLFEMVDIILMLSSSMSHIDITVNDLSGALDFKLDLCMSSNWYLADAEKMIYKRVK